MSQFYLTNQKHAAQPIKNKDSKEQKAFFFLSVKNKERFVKRKGWFLIDAN